MRAFTRITSHLATMDEGLKAVDDMVTRVVRVPKRAEQRVGYGQTVSSRSSESLHAHGGNGKAGAGGADRPVRGQRGGGGGVEWG